MKTGNTRLAGRARAHARRASMEPGHEDREYVSWNNSALEQLLPQWSPVMKTGNTSFSQYTGSGMTSPQWSPVMKTGNTRTR